MLQRELWGLQRVQRLRVCELVVTKKELGECTQSVQCTQAGVSWRFM